MVFKKFALTLLVLALFTSFAFAGDEYKFDAAHSSAGFTVSHLVISKTTGKFDDISAKVNLDESDLTKSSVDVTIKVASINTGDAKRDGHLKSPDFFDAEKNPDITFKSTKIAKTDDGYAITGNLTIKAVTKEVTFPFKFNGFAEFMGTKRFGAEATLTINRQDYGVTWNKKLDSGGVVVGNEVEIGLHLEGFKELGTN